MAAQAPRRLQELLDLLRGQVLSVAARAVLESARGEGRAKGPSRSPPSGLQIAAPQGHFPIYEYWGGFFELGSSCSGALGFCHPAILADSRHSQLGLK
jgi:hypothetical protein